jgi:hypothetical protein
MAGRRDEIDEEKKKKPVAKNPLPFIPGHPARSNKKKHPGYTHLFVW